jgi:hypothetical protein
MNLLNITWTSELVEEWIGIAVQVERVLPSVGPRMARPHIEYPTDWLARLWDELDDYKPAPRFQPTNEQVSMWEEVALRWIPMIDSVKDRKILWWRACGMSWNRIGKKLSLERHTIASRHKRALEELAKSLNKRHST